MSYSLDIGSYTDDSQLVVGLSFQSRRHLTMYLSDLSIPSDVIIGCFPVKFLLGF